MCKFEILECSRGIFCYSQNDFRKVRALECSVSVFLLGNISGISAFANAFQCRFHYAPT